MPVNHENQRGAGMGERDSTTITETTRRRVLRFWSQLEIIPQAGNQNDWQLSVISDIFALK
jgi:hypothetical protein